MTKSAQETETSINMEARRECENIMQKIYNENPSYWPNGLDIASHDGGVYMIREASTKKAIGFTGWQERMDGDSKVGFYSIGILPEYRNNGYAKQAVAKLISIKSANVDRVHALVMKHNEPSLALADSLKVPVVKFASEKQANARLKELFKFLGVGGSVAGGLDVLEHGQGKTFDEYKDTPFTVDRAIKGLINMGLGGVTALKALPTVLRAEAGLAIPTKEFFFTGSREFPRIAHSLERMSGGLAGLSPSEKALAAAGLLGAGFVGLRGVNALKDIAKSQTQASKGKIRVALPTKDPTDQETTLELPIEEIDVSDAQFSKLQRDLRKRIRKETSERTERRGPRRLMSPAERLALPKSASFSKANVERIATLIKNLNV